MGVKKWIQDMLPVFTEPILPGDFVKVARYIQTKDDLDTLAVAYVGHTGQVVTFDSNLPFPYEVEFENGHSYLFSQAELERRA